MKPERSFVADRPLASHCAELVRPVAAPESGPDALSAMAARLIGTLPERLAGLLGGKAPLVQAGIALETDINGLSAQIEPLAANCLYSAGAAGQLLVSIEAEAVLRMLDKAFGGSGRVPDPLPPSFPLTAELMIARLEDVVASALARAIPAAGQIRPLRRDESLSRLAPFAKAEPLVSIVLSLVEGEADPWRMTLAVPQSLLAGWGEHGAPEAAAGGMQPADPASRLNPLAGPIGDVPLTLRAVLVDMRIAFSALSALQPGQVIPVAVARNVPLCLGERVIAHGTVGAMDDCVALQISQLS